MLGHHADCIAGMRPWQELARREEHQLPAQASEFYSQLGRCQHYASRYDDARLMFERSLAPRRDPPQNEAGVVENPVQLAPGTEESAVGKGRGRPCSFWWVP